MSYVIRPSILPVAGRQYRVLHSATPSNTTTLASFMPSAPMDASAATEDEYRDEPNCLAPTLPLKRYGGSGKKPSASPVAASPTGNGGSGSGTSARNSPSSAPSPAASGFVIHIEPSFAPFAVLLKLSRMGASDPHGLRSIETRFNVKISLVHQNRSRIASIESQVSMQSVQDAKAALRAAVREAASFTHFISIPLHDPSLTAGITAFTERVLQENQQSHGLKHKNLDATVLVPPTQLHLTVGMLTLLDKQDIDLAARVLASCSDIASLPFMDGVSRDPAGHAVIEVSGVDYMNDDPREVDVVYGIPKLKLVDSGGSAPSINPLQAFADAVTARFISAGLMKKEFAHIKLHATLINTKYRKQAAVEAPAAPLDDEDEDAGAPATATAGGEEGSDKKGKSSSGSGSSSGKRAPKFPKRIPVDASDILASFKSHVFGTSALKTVHLSQLAKDPETKYYRKISEWLL